MAGHTSRVIIRVLSNNALLARDGDVEMVLLGKGIGFGRKDGDLIDESAVQQFYVEVDPHRHEYLNWANDLGNGLLEAISRSVDIAAEVLGPLHPAVYTLLLDHIAFAIQRLRSGQEITNPLTPQIRELYPDEFAAAHKAVHYLSERLNIQLPDDEAGFIALHLNAASAGQPVKEPLQRANALAGLVDQVTRGLGSNDAHLRGDITRALVALSHRLAGGQVRRNDALLSIRRDLAHDYQVSSQIITEILDVNSVPKNAEGEAAYLAVDIHGWRQEINAFSDNNRKAT